jgi:hypothetical protein
VYKWFKSKINKNGLEPLLIQRAQLCLVCTPVARRASHREIYARCRQHVVNQVIWVEITVKITCLVIDDIPNFLRGLPSISLIQAIALIHLLKLLCRARIGHTHLTHSYLLKGEDQPECIPCQCALTVKHILIDCVDFSIVRQSYFNVKSLKELFDTIDTRVLLKYLKEIGLYYKF